MQVDHGDWKTCCRVLREELAEPGRHAFGRDGVLIRNCHGALRKDRRRKWHEYELAHGRDPERSTRVDWTVAIAAIERMGCESDWSPSDKRFFDARQAEMASILQHAVRLPRASVPHAMAPPIEGASERDICLSVLRRVSRDVSAAADPDVLLHLCRALSRAHKRQGRHAAARPGLNEFWYYAVEPALRQLLENPYAAPDPLVLKTAIKAAAGRMNLDVGSSKGRPPNRFEPAKAPPTALVAASAASVRRATSRARTAPRPGFWAQLLRWFR